MKAALSGDFGGARGKVAVNLSAARPAISLHQDVDSIGIYCDTIPVNQGKVIINITSAETQHIRSKSHVGIQLPGEVHHTDVNKIPNYFFARFGDLGCYNVSETPYLLSSCQTSVTACTVLIIMTIVSSFKVAICFPSYTSRWGNKILCGVDIGYFVDQVVIPALHETFKSQGMVLRNAMAPFSQEENWLSHRSGNSSMWNSYTTLPRNLWPLLLQEIRRRIGGLDENYAILFKDPFFFIYAHGMKESIDIFANQEEMTLKAKLEAVFSDVDWSIVDDSQVFMDFGFEFHVPESVGLWKCGRPLDRISHRRLLKKFFGPKLVQAQYEKYTFGGVKNVAGFRYLSKDIFEGLGIFKLHKLIGYQSLKEHFVKKGKVIIENRSSTNQIVSPSDVWERSKRFLGIMVSFSALNTYLY